MSCGRCPVIFPVLFRLIDRAQQLLALLSDWKKKKKNYHQKVQDMPLRLEAPSNK